ncbi:Panacea domain-containing protein [Arcobacter sp. LA11]|uniref:Panacea domain-containing protein n=1 Tax=Arcobacter sp. LA11 TaxID=1898176 RepID=UPI000ABA9A31|nr:Panacea domain-containing protein [Arcobacter sp. LA11]
MKFDITKVANVILYMLNENVLHLNDRKLSILLFLMDFNHLENCEDTIFGEEYIKDKRNPEPRVLSELFDIIANQEDLDEEDERLFLIQEILDYIDIEVITKDKFIELQFIKMDEEFDETLFDKEELKTINKIITKYKDETARKIANACFQIDKVRQTQIGETII